MSTQAINAGVWGPQGGREFSATATDDVFTNNLTTDTGSANLGEAMKNQIITHILVDYAAGGAIFRVKNRVSQQTLIQGFAFLTGQADPSQAQLPKPYTVHLDDVLEVYCVGVPT